MAVHRAGLAEARLGACILLVGWVVMSTGCPDPGQGGHGDMTSVSNAAQDLFGAKPPDLFGVAPPDLFGVPPGTDLGTSGSGCLAEPLLTSLGKTNILVGASMTAATAKLAPFDARYLYLSGGLFDSTTPCSSCLSCTAFADACCSSGAPGCPDPQGCAWWGCWQDDAQPPGGYVRDFITSNQNNQYMSAARPLLPMITYYEELQASEGDKQGKEGPAQLAALEGSALLTRYFNDWRFLLQQIGDDVVLLHIEPDLWGYVEQADTQSLPATKPPVATANPTDCSGEPSTMTGFARCLIKMVRKYAPNAKVGLHASPWGTSMDVVANANLSLDVKAEAEQLADFLAGLGAQDGDYIVADVSDRDAGWDQMNGDDTWWDKTNATLPNFSQAFAWSKALAERLGMPVLWWQIPVGNEGLNDTYQKYRDNRVDYLLTHMDEVQAAHITGLFFGGGMSENTTPETDGGNLVNRVKASAAAHAACP